MAIDSLFFPTFHADISLFDRYQTTCESILELIHK